MGTSRPARAAGLVILLLLLAPAGGCMLHRNLMLRWHLEFDADSVPDQCVPPMVDRNLVHKRNFKKSKLGRPGCEPPCANVPHEQPSLEEEVVLPPTPAQLGKQRFHPVPTKPVFPEPTVPEEQIIEPPRPELIPGGR